MKHVDSIPEADNATVENLARVYREKHDTDVVFYNAPIDELGFWRLASSCIDQDAMSRNIMLILLTYGGSAEWAYKMARFLQDRYAKFSVSIPYQCKSAGTILVIGAHEIVMSPYGELGPLDVQVLKEDEFLERRSGAAVVSALEVLKEKSFEMFDWLMIRIKASSGGAITLRTSTDISTSLVTGLFKEIFGQIDPNYLGEMNRNMLVAYEYGKRLAKIGENIKENGVRRLVYDYPSHEFVIDIREARELFRRVRSLEGDLRRIIAALENRCGNPRNYGGDDEYDIALLSSGARIFDESGGDDETASPNTQGEGKDGRDEGAGKADPRRSRAKIRTTDGGAHRERKAEASGAESPAALRRKEGSPGQEVGLTRAAPAAPCP